MKIVCYTELTEKKAFKLGYNIKNCKGKACINCDNYNGVGWFDENNIPQISCRLGGYHYGLDACGDFEQVEND